MNRPSVRTKPQSQRANAADRALNRWGFPASIAFGFALGFALIPVAEGAWAGAGIALGAFLIAGVAARQALGHKAEREVLQQRLQDEASYHAFVDSAIEGFFRTTHDGRYLIVNPALARIYGYDGPEQLMTEVTDIGQSLYVDAGRRAEFERLIAANGRVKDFVSQIRRRDGALIWISENALTVKDEDGQFLFYEGTVEDITSARESDDAVRRALAETQDAARAKAAFLAGMSHELKTPLNAVIGFSDLIRQELFGPVGSSRYKEYIADIHQNGLRLLGMINDILDLSRIEGRLLDLEDGTVHIGEAVQVASNAVIEDKPEAAPIRIEVPPHLPLLKVDPRRLHQVLTHLLSNAVKFTPHDGTISVRASMADDGGIAIAVVDTGIGMEPERIAHALEPFKQLDDRLARRFDGVGLGLPLANALLQLHEGSLSIESRPGAGTTVTAHFPPARIVAVARAA